MCSANILSKITELLDISTVSATTYEVGTHLGQSRVLPHYDAIFRIPMSTGKFIHVLGPHQAAYLTYQGQATNSNDCQTPSCLLRQQGF